MHLVRSLALAGLLHDPRQREAIPLRWHQHWMLALADRQNISGNRTVAPEAEGVTQFMQSGGLQCFRSQPW